MYSEIKTLINTGSRDEAYKIVNKFFGQHKPRYWGMKIAKEECYTNKII